MNFTTPYNPSPSLADLAATMNRLGLKAPAAWTEETVPYDHPFGGVDENEREAEEEAWREAMAWNDYVNAQIDEALREMDEEREEDEEPIN